MLTASFQCQVDTCSWNGKAAAANCLAPTFSRRSRLSIYTGMRGDTRCVPPLAAQPLPRVDPAFDFAVLLEPSFARTRPAFDSAAFVGLLVLPEPLPIAFTSSPARSVVGGSDTGTRRSVQLRLPHQRQSGLRRGVWSWCSRVRGRVSV